ncbi:hypothetical protein GCM10022215_17770 [Nocardioides fonticola]|uniref:C2H2-type domain-containing protein n=1 Tax=Nocardioides fonticola TaxID=450363 RepID=A0ABP7XJ52_9ACTN
MTHDTTHDPYTCPFCPAVFDPEDERTRLALVAFEQHLDVHMIRRDTLRPRVPAVRLRTVRNAA